jgi:hypothetical protein
MTGPSAGQRAEAIYARYLSGDPEPLTRRMSRQQMHDLLAGITGYLCGCLHEDVSRHPLPGTDERPADIAGPRLAHGGKAELARMILDLVTYMHDTAAEAEPVVQLMTDITLPGPLQEESAGYALALQIYQHTVLRVSGQVMCQIFESLDTTLTRPDITCPPPSLS